MDQQKNAEGLAWQISVWDRMVPVYVREIDKRFEPIIECVVKRADLKPAQHVLDLGTGTGSVALRAAEAIGPDGRVTAVDISPDMLAIARRRAASAEASITFVEGRAEAIPADAESIDAVLASLSLMYVIDRGAAAREIARVLRPGGRLVGAVWAGPERADIVLLQQTAGSFAPEPPVPGVGPGALGDPASFLAQLADAGVKAHVETETIEFAFDDFASAWDVLAGVTASQLEPERAEAAKAAVRKAMWPHGDGPRRFGNETRFIIGRRIGYVRAAIHRRHGTLSALRRGTILPSRTVTRRVTSCRGLMIA
jgi:SAM-dependent methyltransferase